MRSVSSRKPLPCPPYATLAAPFPDETLRPTVARRPFYVVSVTTMRSGFRPTDLYVRRFWSAVLGVGAITDLLRIVQAGLRGNALRRPVHLATLLTAGLVRVDGQTILVPDRIPPLPADALRTLPPALRRSHAQWFSTRAENPPGGEDQRDDLTNDKADSNPHIRSPRRERHGGQARDQATDPRSGQLAG